MCSSVTGCWLNFSCAGLSSLIALALLGALIWFPSYILTPTAEVRCSASAAGYG